MENVFEDYRSGKIAINDNSIGCHPLARSPLLYTHYRSKVLATWSLGRRLQIIWSLGCATSFLTYSGCLIVKMMSMVNLKVLYNDDLKRLLCLVD